MGFELFSHNQTAYTATLNMLAGTGKAVIIHIGRQERLGLVWKNESDLE